MNTSPFRRLPVRRSATLKMILCAAGVFLAAAAAHAQTGVLASDNAGNASAFGSSSSTPNPTGFGWGSWSWGNTNGGGEYLSQNSTDSGGDKIRVTGSNTTASWGLFANSSGSALASIARNFPSSSLAVGDTVTMQWENGNIANGGSTGVSLWNSSNNNVWEMFFSGGNSDYFFNDSTSANDNSGLAFTNGGMQIDFTLTGATTYSVTVGKLNASGTTTFNGSLANPAGGQAISQLRFFSFGNTSQDTFFNNVKDLLPTYTAGSGNWSSTSNWSSNGTISNLPVNGSNVAFSNSLGGTATNNQLTTVNSIIFNNGAGAYTLTGTTAGANVTLGDTGGQGNAGIVNNSTTAQTVAENFTIGTGVAGTTVGTSINAAAGSLTLSGSVNMGNSRILVAGANTTTISGLVSGAANILMQGTGGTLFLTNAGNSFGPNLSSTGNVVIDAGTVLVGATGALGVTTGGTTGYVNLGTSAAAEDGNSSALLISTSGVTVANPVDVRYYTTATYGTQQIGGSNTSGIATFSGPIALHNSVTVSSVSGGTVNISGVISQGATSGEGFAGVSGTEAVNGTPGITVTGNGTVQLSATNTYAGPTAVNGGTLIVSGSLTGTSSATVASTASMEVDGGITSSATTTVNNGTLDGTGSTGPITANGGTIDPGLTVANSTFVVGTLTAAGNVTLSASTSLDIRLGLTDGSAADTDSLVETSGSVALNSANLVLTIGGAMNNPNNLGHVYVIIADGATDTGPTFGNTFGNAPGNVITLNGYTFNVDYASNSAGVAGAGSDVALTLVAIPEPGTYGMVLGGIGLLLAFQRTRRRRTS